MSRVLTERRIRESISSSSSRVELWIELLRLADVRRMAEVGVYRGKFASRVLRECSSIEKYYMIDPWRHLNDWNKPANKDDDRFERFLRDVKSKTAFASEKRIILRGRTTEVVDRIPDGDLDLTYIDGDHTLRGITIDLIRLYPKVADGGFIGGDDFSKTVWQHRTKFEPTLVFPFAVYFAEAVGAPIYALPRNQFLIMKNGSCEFTFRDLTGRYGNTQLGWQFSPEKLLRLKLVEKFPWLKKASRAIRSIRRKRRS